MSRRAKWFYYFDFNATTAFYYFRCFWVLSPILECILLTLIKNCLDKEVQTVLASTPRPVFSPPRCLDCFFGKTYFWLLIFFYRIQNFCWNSKESYVVLFLEASYNYMVLCFEKQLSFRQGSVIVLLPSAEISEAVFLVHGNLNQVKTRCDLILLFISSFLKDYQRQNCIMPFCNWLT